MLPMSEGFGGADKISLPLRSRGRNLQDLFSDTLMQYDIPKKLYVFLYGFRIYYF